MVGGWAQPLRTGQQVQVEINNQWVSATLIDDGLGKKKVSVILDDDDTLTLQKVHVTRVRPLHRAEWQGSSMIDQESLCKAVISVYEQSKTTAPDDEIILNIRYLLLMLLKVTSQIRWYFLDKENPTFTKFMAILNLITKDQVEAEEDKTKVYWEKALTDSWERLLDRAEARNFDFFVVKEAPEAAVAKSGEAQTKAAVDKNYQDIDFVQPVSSYLRGLPEPVPKRNTSEAALKLLAYWEKNIIPKIIEFVRTTYKPWEMEFYFEQLRFHLRNGDQIRALEDAMTMCEKKMPQGCNVPDENYDWTCKMIDECLVDTWALAKFKAPKGATIDHPLLAKLINFGIEEVVVLIKAVDLRANVVLGEYHDADTMQVHSLWVPVSHLSDLHSPLPPRAIGYPTARLRSDFETSVAKSESIYAR